MLIVKKKSNNIFSKKILSFLLKKKSHLQSLSGDVLETTSVNSKGSFDRLQGIRCLWVKIRA